MHATSSDISHLGKYWKVVFKLLWYIVQNCTIFGFISLFCLAYTLYILFPWVWMRKLCPNLDKEDALETILEVPIPEEMFNNMGNNVALRCQNMQQWMKAQTSDKWSSPVILGRINELRFLLYHVGSPLIPLQVHIDNINRPVRDSSIVSCCLIHSFL